MNSKKILLAPLVIIEFYLLFTIFLFEFGAIEWPVSNKIEVYIFLFAYHLAFITGYIVTIRKNKEKCELKYFRDKLTKVYHKLKIKNFFNKYLYFGLIILLIVNYLRLGRVVNSLNPVIMVKYIFLGLYNSKELYEFKFLLNQNTLIGGRLITVLTTLTSPIYWPIYPLMIYYFKRTNIIQKILFFIAIFLEIGYGISIGTNKVIFDLVIITGTILILKFMFKIMKNGIKKELLFKILFISLISCGIVLLFFNFTMSSRLGGLDRFSNGYRPGIPVNVDKGVIKYFSDSFKFLYIMVCGYLTQGYFGMSLALKLPFISTLGLGNNNFILSNFEEIFNLSIRQYTYQNRITEYYWDPTQNWHTIYTWIANDVSFYGVIIVMLILGVFIAAIWKDIVFKKNIFAICLFPMIVILVVFIPCNNQIFSLPTTFMPFLFLTLFWLISRKGFDKNGKSYK